MRGVKRHPIKFSGSGSDSNPLINYLHAKPTESTLSERTCKYSTHFCPCKSLTSFKDLSKDIRMFARYRPDGLPKQVIDKLPFPPVLFKTDAQSPHYAWGITQVRIFASLCPNTSKPVMVIELQEHDETLFNDILKLMIRRDVSALECQDISGSEHFLVELVDMLTGSVGILLEEAEAHLETLVSCSLPYLSNNPRS